jgi:hypothetical protein
MKKMLFTVFTISIMLALSGCGDGHNSSSTPTYEARILSDQVYDGDIKFVPPNVYTVRQGSTTSVFAGIDPVTGAEYRAFLDFPLTGEVPGNAFIDSATLDIYIDSISLSGGTIPIRIELVSFTPPTLVASDYDDPAIQIPLATITTTIYQGDAGHHVLLDVTQLMDKAQRLGLDDFQIRIMEDLGIVSPGLIEINESTNATAPLLEVIYY